jgi:hypothetical protein
MTDEVTQLNSQLDNTMKQVIMLNIGTTVIEEILESRDQRKGKGISFDYRTMNNSQQKKVEKFVPVECEYNPTAGTQMLKRSAQHHGSNSRRRPRRWVYHHCGRKGHIRPFCFKLYGYPKWYQQGTDDQSKAPTQQPAKEWKPKTENKEVTALRASSRDCWYFDSGCSRHMTGVGDYLDEIKSYATSHVTFGDGAKGEIVGIGKLVKKGLPRLDNVLLVKGLTANLISISQLCDQGMKVNSTQSECEVTDEGGTVLMRGRRSKDNCYLWISQDEKVNLSSCLISKEDEVRLWHQKLGHLHLRGMKRAIFAGATKGLPNLNIEEGKICGECQIGKQTRMSHQKLEHQVTPKALELLHIDLMGSMQVESIGGRRYALVVVDDFSRFT